MKFDVLLGWGVGEVKGAGHGIDEKRRGAACFETESAQSRHDHCHSLCHRLTQEREPLGMLGKSENAKRHDVSQSATTL